MRTVNNQKIKIMSDIETDFQKFEKSNLERLYAWQIK